jgi:acyl carrier protein
MRAETVRALIAEHLGLGLDVVRDDADFAVDLGADSLDMIELAMRLEEALDIAIPDDEIESCATVGDAINIVYTKLPSSQAA